MSSCTASEDIEGCLVLLGLGGYLASLKLCRCCAALLGFCSSSFTPAGRGDLEESRLDLEALIWGVCEEGEVE